MERLKDAIKGFVFSILAIIAVIAVFTVLARLALPVLGELHSYHVTHAEYFDREKWANDKLVKYSMKYRCASSGDLIDNYLPEGMKKTEVLSLLGKQYSPGDTYYGKNCLEYRLGDCFSLLDPDGVLICFDENDRLIDKRLVSH